MKISARYTNQMTGKGRCAQSIPPNGNQAFVFRMLDEMLDALDKGLRKNTVRVPFLGNHNE